MTHLLRCNEVPRIGDANVVNTTAPAASPADNQQNAVLGLGPPGAGNDVSGPTSGASRGAASGTVRRPIRWMRGNRAAW
jgi:hypothetical protein